MFNPVAVRKHFARRPASPTRKSQAKPVLVIPMSRRRQPWPLGQALGPKPAARCRSAYWAG